MLWTGYAPRPFFLPVASTSQSPLTLFSEYGSSLFAFHFTAADTLTERNFLYSPIITPNSFRYSGLFSSLVILISVMVVVLRVLPDNPRSWYQPSGYPDPLSSNRPISLACVSLLISILYPVSLQPVLRSGLPYRWQGITDNPERLPVLLLRPHLQLQMTFAGLKAFSIRYAGLSSQLMISIFSPLNSLTMEFTRAPLITNACSYWIYVRIVGLYCDFLVLEPASRAMDLISTVPSFTSATSNSNRRFTRSG